MADLAIHSGATGPFMTAGVGSQKNDIMQSPRGKLFALDTDGNHVLTCSSKGGIIYKVSKLFLFKLLYASTVKLF